MELDLRAYAQTLWKRRWYALAVLAVFIGLGIAMTARAPRVYRARTSLFVGERQVTLEDNPQLTILQRALSVGLLKSYVVIVKSRSIAQRAVANSGLDASPAQVQGGLTASSPPDTQIIEITYKARDPGRAERILNAVADAFVEYTQRDEDDGTPAVSVSVIDRATASPNPVSPNGMRNVVLATLLGLMGGVGLAFLVDYIDTSVRRREEIEALGLPVLSSIPQLATKKDEVYLERDLQGVGGESFRKLRTSIGFINLESPLRSVLVTSPMPQEGKTTTALNLAAAYALGGLKTVLVEADLRRPSLHRLFGLYGTRGLTTAIVGDVPLTDAIVNTDIRNLSVLTAGAIPPNPVELLGSDQMKDVLDRLERMFDVVVIDTPPLLPVADPAALAGRSDGVVVVARAGKTDRRRLQEAAQVVERAGGRLLGVVLNELRLDAAPDSYDYYSGYRSQQAPAAAGKE